MRMIEEAVICFVIPPPPNHTHQILDQSGNQDSCYYNFKCAHPIWFFSAFNNMWSNIGYILLGFLFVLIVIFRYIATNFNIIISL